MENRGATESTVTEECQILIQRIQELEEKNYSLETRIKELTAANRKHEEDKRKLHEDVISLKNIRQTEVKSKVAEILKPFFTIGQIDALLNKKRRVKWSVEDYGTAITLRNLSPKTYRYLRTKLNYPLPDLSTLRKWAVKQLSLEEGVLHDVLKLMKARATNMSELDRVTVLAFDEMYLNEEVSFDSREEQIIGPHKAVQVVFARGLFARWKQPVYYKYDQTMTKEILTDIICQLEGSGFQVVATVSDLGGSNRKLWRDLKISTKLNCSFPNPNDSTREIFVFFFRRSTFIEITQESLSRSWFQLERIEHFIRTNS